MIKNVQFVISLCTVLVCSGCGKNDNLDDVETYEETEHGDGAETYEETEHENSAETYENVKDFSDAITDEMLNACDEYPSSEEYEKDLKIESYIKEYVALEDDTEIEGYEWMQYDSDSVLHVKIQYKEQPPNAYQHKEAYFLFMTQDDEISQVLVIDYEDKGIHIRLNEGKECAGNHSMGQGCGFDDHFEDVPFDGRKDLIISVGNSRHAAYYCAYICEDDGFRYEKTFEHIPSYKVKSDEQVICGSYTDGMGWFLI